LTDKELIFAITYSWKVAFYDTRFLGAIL